MNILIKTKQNTSVLFLRMHLYFSLTYVLSLMKQVLTLTEYTKETLHYPAPPTFCHQHFLFF